VKFLLAVKSYPLREPFSRTRRLANARRTLGRGGIPPLNPPSAAPSREAKNFFAANNHQIRSPWLSSEKYFLGSRSNFSK
jgi:hypothetical protein